MLSALEFMVAGLSVLGTLVAWGNWYLDVVRVNPLTGQRRVRLLLALAPAVCLLLMFGTLVGLAAGDVRRSPLYVVFYLLLGSAWLGLARALFALLGVSFRDDVLERQNPAALWTLLGGLLGVTLCFAGGNVGEGPGVEAVLASAGLATAGLALSWLLLEWMSGHAPSERVTIERDIGAGMRLAGFLVANGAILGFAVAGDWMPGSLLRDFAAFSWPALLLTVIATLAERGASWTRLRSALLAAAYVGSALAYILSRGTRG